MKTPFALAIAIVISAPVFAQSVKTRADQRTSAATSLNSDRNRLASSASSQNSGSLNIDKSNESSDALRASGDAAVRAKQETLAKGKEEATSSSAVYVSSNTDAGTRVQADESKNSTSANTQVKVSAKADPASTIDAGVESADRLHTNVMTRAKVESRSAVKIAATESASAKTSIDGKIGSTMKPRSNINAVQSNTVKMKPVSLHSKAMASSKIRL